MAYLTGRFCGAGAAQAGDGTLAGMFCRRPPLSGQILPALWFSRHARLRPRRRLGRQGGKPRDGLQNGERLRGLREAVNEHLVDLEPVEGNSSQLAQAGIAAAEIVERPAKPRRLQARHERGDALDVGQQHRLGDLHFEAARTGASRSSALSAQSNCARDTLNDILTCGGRRAGRRRRRAATGAPARR